MDLKERLSSVIATDIIRGYSVLKCEKGTAYLRHFKMLEYMELDEFEDQSFEDAIKSGIKSEKELIESAIEGGFWSKAIDEEFEALKWTIEKQNEAIEKMADPSQKEMFRKSTKNVEDNYKKLLEKKNKIIGYSAESLALRRRTAKLVEGNVFKDKKLTKKVSKDSFDSFAVHCYLKIRDLFDRDNLIRSAYSNLFFEAYIYQNKSPMTLFGERFADLTVFQSKLITFANALYSKLKYTDKIPNSVSQDAIKLYFYDESKEKTSSGEEITGIEDLKQKMKQKGKVTSEDFLS